MIAAAMRTRKWKRIPSPTYLGAAILIVIGVCAVAPKFVAPYDPLAFDFGALLQAPSLRHPFGTDQFGRDILSRVIAASQVDLPIAGLLKDLKQRGLLEETLVVWGTEFGRTPGAQGDGRDHHPQGFCAWLAGGGIKGGVVHGATDQLGFHAIEQRHYVTDVHATVLHQLGLDARRLEMPGRRRLDIDYGQPIREILA